MIDSHTGGEPTRLVVGGGPDLGRAPLPERLRRLREEYDWFRSAVVNEPRGSDVIVGALLTEPADPTATAGVIFFNNVGYLGMCGHGTIGLVASLAYQGRIGPGEHRIETPAGMVTGILHETGEVTVQNVVSYRHLAGVAVDIPGYGRVHGDVAWGGNWFFLVEQHKLELSPANIEKLTDFSWSVRRALEVNRITGADGHEIDHVELLGAPRINGADSKNFVLCPGGAYDRSPCGTGTSAKLACLYADGKFREGQLWRQESIIGSMFEGSIQVRGGQVHPSIKGSAFVSAEADLILDESDPFRTGIPV
ncbi:MAG TPA: proline racemase family protein [Bryobacteraceae bacterium]